MNAFPIPEISVCGEPLSEVISLAEHDDPLTKFVPTATIYKRHPLPDMDDLGGFGGGWAAPWLLFCAYDDKLSKKVYVGAFENYDDAEASAKAWVYNGETPAWNRN